MIIKGNPAGNVAYWSAHLMNDEKNERVEVKEITGLLAEDLPSALREMEGVAAGSRSEGNFMYAANINPLAHEHLTPEQWIETVNTLEKNLGLEGHQRVVIEHVKDGRQHYHVMWNRVDVDTMRVADIGGNYRIHEDTSRDLELRFGLTRVPSSDRDHQPAWELWEARAAERSGIDPKQMKAELTDLWRQADNGQAFKAAIEERGYVLARGDRRDFVVVDRAGDVHSLARRLDGVNTRQVREKMADLDKDRVPSLQQARDVQRLARASDREIGKIGSEVRLAWALSDSADGFQANLEAQGMTLARTSVGEAAASHTAAEFAKAIGRYVPRLQEGELVVVNGFGGVTKLDERTTGETRRDAAKYLATLDHAALPNVTDARVMMKDQARAEFYAAREASRERTPTEQKVDAIFQQSAPAEFRGALAHEGFVIARVDQPGIEGLARDQRLAFALDNQAHGLPKLAPGELVAVNAYGGVHRLSPHRLDLDGIEKALTVDGSESPALSEVRDGIEARRHAEKGLQSDRAAEFWRDYRERKDAAFDARLDAWQEYASREENRLNDPRIGRKLEQSALMVSDAASGVVDTLMNFVAGRRKEPVPKNPSAAEKLERIRQQRRAKAALERMQESMERGEHLAASDVLALTDTHIENIRLKGDSYVHGLIESMERNRSRDHDYGRTRER